MKTVKCATCRKKFQKYPSQVRQHNFCSNQCRLIWFGIWTTENLNVPGHSAGHKAPHLTKLNRERNPACSLHKNKVHVRPSVYRAIAEEMLGRKLRANEVVHHINGDRTDIRPENLQVMGKAEHHRLHMQIAMSRTEGGDGKCQKK